MTARTETVVLSSLLSDLPAAPAPIREQVAGPLLRALDLVPTVPAWITDPGLRADIPDDLHGGA